MEAVRGWVWIFSGIAQFPLTFLLLSLEICAKCLTAIGFEIFVSYSSNIICWPSSDSQGIL